MAIKMTRDSIGAISTGVCLFFHISAALATAKWGGRVVKSLNRADLLGTGIVAAVQVVTGLLLAPLLFKGAKKSATNGFKIKGCLSLMVGNLITGAGIYAIGLAAFKANQIPTALTLPAVASLVIVPA